MWCCLLPEKRQRKLASLFTSAMPSDRPNGNANVAFGRSAIQVGGRSTLGHLKTRLCIALLAVLVDITRLQVPPRSPKRQSKGCLFFVSKASLAEIWKKSIITVPKNNGMPSKRNIRGIMARTILPSIALMAPSKHKGKKYTTAFQWMRWYFCLHLPGEML